MWRIASESPLSGARQGGSDDRDWVIPSIGQSDDYIPLRWDVRFREKRTPRWEKERERDREIRRSRFNIEPQGRPISSSPLIILPREHPEFSSRPNATGITKGIRNSSGVPLSDIHRVFRVFRMRFLEIGRRSNPRYTPATMCSALGPNMDYALKMIACRRGGGGERKKIVTHARTPLSRNYDVQSPNDVVIYCELFFLPCAINSDLSRRRWNVSCVTHKKITPSPPEIRAINARGIKAEKLGRAIGIRSENERYRESKTALERSREEVAARGREVSPVA